MWLQTMLSLTQQELSHLRRICPRNDHARGLVGAMDTYLRPCFRGAEVHYPLTGSMVNPITQK